MTWAKIDDKWFSNRKLRALPRAARGLFVDLISWSCGDGSDGWLPATVLGMLETSPTDPDFKKLVGTVLHKKGDECRCLLKRKWEWPRERGWVIHDFLTYNPAKDETDVRRAQKAELRDWALRHEIRVRDHGCCRYCGEPVKQKDNHSPLGETVDHVDPKIADGANNLVLACKADNGRKQNKTPEQAGMVLLTEEELGRIVASRRTPRPITAEQIVAWRNDDMSAIPSTTGGQTRRDGTGSGRAGTGTEGAPSPTQVGPPTTPRDSANPNPYLRTHTSPDDPSPPTQPDPPAAPARASPPPSRRHKPPKSSKSSRRRRR